MAIDISSEETQITFVYLMTLLGSIILVILGFLFCWYGLFIAPFVYLSRLKSLFYHQVIQDSTKEQVDAMLRNNGRKLKKNKRENWLLLSSGQRLYAISRIDKDNEQNEKAASRDCVIEANFTKLDYLNLNYQTYQTLKMIRSVRVKSLNNVVCLEISETSFKSYIWSNVIDANILLRLESVIITKSYFKDDAFEDFCSFLRLLKKLVVINLSNCLLNQVDTHFLANVFENTDTLKVFKMQKNKGDINVTKIIRSIIFREGLIIDIFGTKFIQSDMFNCLSQKMSQM